MGRGFGGAPGGTGGQVGCGGRAMGRGAAMHCAGMHGPMMAGPAMVKIKLTGAAIKKHVQRHSIGPVNRAGRKYKLDEEAENQLVEIVLLMRKAHLPTWGSIMKKICKGLISGTKY